MTAPPIFSTIEPISLGELNDLAALDQRVDRKYVLREDELLRLIQAIEDRVSILEIDERRSFGYSSVYFDTVTMESYLGAALSRRRRFKVRTRSYLDAGDTVLEIKTRGFRGQTIKTRQVHRFDQPRELGDRGSTFVDEMLDRPGLSSMLRPALTTSYDRTTLIDQAGLSRLTIDADLCCRDDANTLHLANRYVVETKSPGGPGVVDRFLWGQGVRPQKISKFGTGLAALQPALPSNKWHRTLERHFSD